ncbi:MAG: hypothetical protein Q8S73_02990 [Deltaproteobacteria bacterium]|nr:hypothetical protein [Myxococcales bacterium]MDP3213045.1 hypothetical protein [Deltaproteobacteria bacterium]
MKPTSPSPRPSSLLRGAALAVAFALAGVPLSYAHRGAAQTPPAAEGTYAVRLHRAVRVGQRARITVEGEKHQTTHIDANGRPPTDREEHLQVHFRAVERVLAVSPEGKALQSEYTIERLESEDASGSRVLLRPGQVVTVARAQRGAEARVTVGGRPVDRPVREALGVVVSMSIGGASDDEVFGTTQRQAVGAVWPINAEVAQRDLLRTANVTATLSGQTRINGAATVQRTPCLDVSAEMNGTITAMANLPPRSSVRSGTMRVTLRGMFPVAPTTPALSSSMEMTMDVHVDLPPSAASAHNEIRITVREGKTGTVTPIGR